MRKLLFIQYVKGFAGSEKYLQQLVTSIAAVSNHTYQPVFLCVYPSDSKNKLTQFITSVKSKGVTVYEHIDESGFSFSTFRTILRIVRKEKIALVHSNLIHSDVWCSLLKMIGLLPVPIVSVKHGYEETHMNRYGFDLDAPKPKGLYPFLISFTDFFISRSLIVSEGLHQFFIRHKLLSANKTQTLLSGFDFPTPDPAVSASFRFSPRQLIISGRLVKLKGHRYVLKALASVLPVFPDTKLVVVGSGPEEETLKAYANELGVKEAVIWVGFTTQVMEYLAASDVFLMTSLSEGFGLVTLEAMKAGLPVIGFDVTATNEIVKDGETGFLVPSADADALAQRIILLLQNQEMAHSMGLAGAALQEKQFSLKRMTLQTIAVFDELLNNRKTSPKA